MADSGEGRLLLHVQRGRLGGGGRQLAPSAAARVLALPRPVAPLPPVAIPVATCVDPNCILNDFEIPSAVVLAAKALLLTTFELNHNGGSTGY